MGETHSTGLIKLANTLVTCKVVGMILCDIEHIAFFGSYLKYFCAILYKISLGNPS